MMRTLSPAFAYLAALALMTSPSPDPGIRQPVEAVPMTWEIERYRDPASGRRTCQVRSRGGHVTALLSKQGHQTASLWSVTVGVDNQPRSLRYLRINRHIHQTAEESFHHAESAEIVAELKKPGEFVFEWFQRPHTTKRGGLFANGDFATKAAECENWLAGTRT